jgi:hypothetical protein
VWIFTPHKKPPALLLEAKYFSLPSAHLVTAYFGLLLQQNASVLQGGQAIPSK